MTAEKENELRKEIDEDRGLRSKRTLLTGVALVLLAVELSGAKIEEANTFILKVVFTQQKGLSILLVLAIIFLLIRYYNYARPYHEKLFKLWSGRMLNELLFFDEHQFELYGPIIEWAPFDIQEQMHHDRKYGWSYDVKFFLARGIKYEWKDEHENVCKIVNVFKQAGFLKFMQVLYFECRYRISSLLTHRENLDIMAPYFIGGLSLASYFFNAQLHSVLAVMLGN